MADNVAPRSAEYYRLNMDTDEILRGQAVDLMDGRLAQRVFLSGGTLMPFSYDEMEITYVEPGNNGAGEVKEVIYKKNSVAVSKVVNTYDSTNRLVNSKRASVT